MPSRLAALLCAPTILLALAGCGGGDSDEASSTPPPLQSGQVTVDMKNTEFVPRDVRVKTGTEITWVNQDSIDHNAVADDEQNEIPKSELFGKGKSYSVAFEKPGKIKYVCTIHPGMEGTIEVVK